MEVVHAIKDAGMANALTEFHARSQTLTYDDLNRLWTASGLYGSQSYTYDGVGNRLTRVIGGTTDTYAYSSTANQISTITTGSNVRTFTYLNSGQTSDDVRDPSNDYTFSYNNNGRSVTAKLNSSAVGSYTYNAFEQRVEKSAGSTDAHFIFDRFGHLLAEADGATGAIQREYIWLDDLPVAVVDDTGASPALYFIHTDQLGTPQKITDASANVVWDGTFDPFGGPASLTGSLTNNLRFPGQYFDGETALHQNWNRDYDLTIGRYIESDPVGLTSGTNTYNYAFGNPVTADDAVGLCPFCIVIVGVCAESGCEAMLGLLGITAMAVTSAGRKAIGRAGKAVQNSLDCPQPDDCEREWEEAREICRRELSKPNPNRGITGGYGDVENCARGHVSESAAAIP